MMMPDHIYKYLHTDDTESESDSDQEVTEPNETLNEQKEADEEPLTESAIFPNVQHYLGMFTSSVGKIFQTVSNMLLSTTVTKTVELFYDVFDYSAQKLDAVVYTALTYFYLSFAFTVSSFFQNSEKAFKELMYDGSRLLYQIEYDNKDTTQRMIYLASTSAFDLYLPFTFLPHLRFKIWDCDSSLNRTFIPESFFVHTREEVEKAIDDGYSIVLHKKSFLSDVENEDFFKIARSRAVLFEVVNANGLSNWFPVSSDFSIYAFPQASPIKLEYEECLWKEFPPQRQEKIDSIPSRRPLLAVLSMFALYPFQTTFNLIVKYIAVRNLNYNQTCFVNPETLLFLTLLICR